MIKFVKKFTKIELVRTGFWTGISSVISSIAVFVVQKIIAVYVGPAGLAVFSQFQNFIGVASSISGAGINVGTTRYLAEHKNDQEKTDAILSTSLKITLTTSLFVSLLIFSFSEELSKALFENLTYTSIIKIFAITLTLFSLNSLLVAILNGFNEIKKFIASGITRSLVVLLLTIIFTYYLGLYGALLSISIVQSIVFFVTLFFVLNSKWFSLKILFKKFDKSISSKLFAFSAVAVSSAVLPPILHIGIREFIINHLSIRDAGCWDAMNKLSEGYFSIISLVISVYFLPKFSFIKEKTKLKIELINGFKIIIPFFLLIILVTYACSEIIILLLYTPEFLLIENLILPFLIGDLFKVLFAILGVLMKSRSNIKMFLTLEIGFTILNYFFAIFFIGIFGLVGGAYAHLVRTFIRVVVSIFLVKKYILN